MGFLDRLFGRSSEPAAPARTEPAASPRPPEQLTDEQALERYRYLVRTAPPDRIEQAHEEAFAAMTPEQRRRALEDLSAEVPEHERATSDDPRSLARMATRAELNRPGTVERAFGGGGMLGGAGGLLLGSFAAAFVGSTIASALWQDYGGGEGDGGDQGAEGDEGDAGAEADAGADSADAGGDFGGGDLGGGDFGGGF
jgi:hypothetical protein